MQNGWNNVLLTGPTAWQLRSVSRSQIVKGMSNCKIKNSYKKIIALKLIPNLQMLSRLQEEHPSEGFELFLVATLFDYFFKIEILHGSLKFLQKIYTLWQFLHQLTKIFPQLLISNLGVRQKYSQNWQYPAKRRTLAQHLIERQREPPDSFPSERVDNLCLFGDDDGSAHEVLHVVMLKQMGQLSQLAVILLSFRWSLFVERVLRHQVVQLLALLFAKVSNGLSHLNYNRPILSPNYK